MAVGQRSAQSIGSDLFFLNSLAANNVLLRLQSLTDHFTLKNPSPVRIQLVNEKGVILDRINEQMAAQGAHTYTFALDKLKQNGEMSLVIYKLVTNEHDESKKILLIK